MDFADTLLNVAHEQLSGNAIQKADAEQQHTGSEQAHDHIPGRRHDRPAVLFNHDQAAGRNRIDLDKHVSGKQVVRINQCQQRREQKIYHDVVKILFGLFNLLLPFPHATEHGEQHDQAEKDRHDCFEHANPDLIAPRSRKVTHLIDVIRAIFQDKCEHRRIRRSDECDDHQIQPPCRLSVQNGGERTRE